MSIFKETFPQHIREQLGIRKHILMEGVKGADQSFPHNPNIGDRYYGRFTRPISGLMTENGQHFYLTPGAFWTYTTQKQAVIRMSSGVDIKKDTFKGTDFDGQYGKDLAKQWVLEGGLIGSTEVKSRQFGYNLGGMRDEDTKKNKDTDITFNQPRSGIGEGDNTAYGSKSARANASADGFGIVPMPGIKDISVRTTSAYGSLRVAKVNFTCHNRRQLEILELLYMRPGFPILLEWGWLPYIHFEKNLETGTYTGIHKENMFPSMDAFWKSTSKLEELNEEITINKVKSGGNYDGFVGFCKNFEFKAREDGGYDCTTDIIAMGEILDGLKGNKTDHPKKKARYYLNHDLWNSDNEGKKKFNNAYTDAFDLDDIHGDTSGYDKAFQDNPGVELCDELEWWLQALNSPERIVLLDSLNGAHSGPPNYTGTSGPWDFYDDYNNYKTNSWAYSDEHIDFWDQLANGTTEVGGSSPHYILADMLINIWDEEYINSPSEYGGSEIFGYFPDKAKRIKKHQRYSPPGQADWGTTLSDRQKVNIAGRYMAGQGVLARSAYTIPDKVVFTASATVNPDSQDWKSRIVDGISTGIGGILGYTTAIGQTPEQINYEYLEDIHQYVRWDFLCEIINHFVIEKYRYDITGNKFGKDDEPLVKLTYLRDSNPQNNESISEYLQYTPYHTDDNNHFASQSSARGYDNVGELMDRSINPFVCFPGNQVGLNTTNMIVVGVNSKFNESDFHQVKGKAYFPFQKKTHYNDVPLFPLRGNHINNDATNIGYFYLNLKHLIGKYKAMKSSNPQVNLFDYLSSVWEDVSNAMGGKHNFRLHTELEKSNTIRVVDLEGAKVGSAYNTPIFEIPIQVPWSIVRDFNYNSTIPDALSATIAIAAQAADSIDDLDKVTFKAFNEKTENRFSKAVSHADPLQIYNDQKKQYLKNIHNIVRFFANVTTGNWMSDDQYASSGGENILNIGNYIKEVEELIIILNSKDPKTGLFSKKVKMPKSAIIPLNWNCVMDGIGGIVIGNIFKLPKSRLPLGYQGDDVAFVVLKESQKVTAGQDWTTSIQGQLMLLDVGGSGNPSSPGIISNVSNNSTNELNNITSTTDELAPSQQAIALEIMDWLIDRGATISSAAAIIGNMVAESGLIVDRLEVGANSGFFGGVGLWQWTGRKKDRTDRRDKFEIALGLPLATGTATQEASSTKAVWQQGRADNFYAGNFKSNYQQLLKDGGWEAQLEYLWNTEMSRYRRSLGSTPQDEYKRITDIGEAVDTIIEVDIRNAAFLCWYYFDEPPTKAVNKKSKPLAQCKSYGYKANQCYCRKGQTDKASARVVYETSRSKRFKQAEKAFNTYKNR